MMTLLLSILLPLSSILTDTTQLQLRQDLQKDLDKLQQSRYFISDNTTLSPNLQTVANDLQLFGLVSNLDLSQATYTWQQEGEHQVHRWRFDEGQIKSITQIQTNMQVDTVVTQRYLENRPATQHRIQNSFTFRTYLISTADDQHKLYYLTEDKQGLLAYRLGEKQVEVKYSEAKEGLSDVLPGYRKEIASITGDI
ncbi:MAG: hypothetical protein LPK03_06745 [Pontibacter sp.]|nr:hypothetical protein [Pontibacter sp.]